LRNVHSLVQTDYIGTTCMTLHVTTVYKQLFTCCFYYNTVHTKRVQYSKFTKFLKNFGKFWKIPRFPENPGISGKCRGKFPGFRGKLLFGISEIPKLLETFSANFMFFIKTALCSSVHAIKFRVKLIKIRVFS
jgi:hypothetical protein